MPPTLPHIPRTLRLLSKNCAIKNQAFTARGFSNLTTLRNTHQTLAQNTRHLFHMKPKPVAQKADWKVLARHIGDPLLFFFPFMGVVVLWPLVGEMILDGHL